MSVGLLEADGRPKEITFKPNFTNVRAARGFTPLSQPAKTGDFLRQSIGLKVKPVEDVPAPSLDEGDDVPTDMAVAMQAATEKKRGGKKNSRSRSSDKE